MFNISTLIAFMGNKSKLRGSTFKNFFNISDRILSNLMRKFIFEQKSVAFKNGLYRYRSGDNFHVYKLGIQIITFFERENYG